MAMVYMYTVYSDLLTNITEATLKLQRSRDIIVRNAMIQEDLPEFPMDENNVGNLFSFFKEMTRKNPFLNIFLLYMLNGKDSSAIIIRNNKVEMYANKQLAIDSITKTPGGKYQFVTCPVIR